MADQYARLQAASEREGALRDTLQRADQEVRDLRLKFYKKAKFAKSFKWRLLQNGVERNLADDVTAGKEHESAIRQELLDESTGRKLAEMHLRVLEAVNEGALRVVDKFASWRIGVPSFRPEPIWTALMQNWSPNNRDGRVKSWIS